jgi:hypothetical protein
MAGYLMNLDSEAALDKCLHSGVYATRSKRLHSRSRHSSLQATFAEYSTMKPGDNIYFFFKRKIYGIGRLCKVGPSCRYLNYPSASQFKNHSYSSIRNSLLYDTGRTSARNRWVCLFEPAPALIKEGVDMDDLLSSSPSSFRMLRAFWKVSFIKFDDAENNAFKSALLQRTGKGATAKTANAILPHIAIHHRIGQKLGDKTDAYEMNPLPIYQACAHGSTLKHEMALEAGLLSQLAEGHKNTLEIFGQWDYLTHQVVASPFKPIDYMDKMDVFGYAYVKDEAPVRERYLVAELKAGTARSQDLEQLMKYVDWVNQEYAYGHMGLIHAFLIANKFEDKIFSLADKLSARRYLYTRRPPKFETWRNLTFVSYSYNERTGRVLFERVKDNGAHRRV